MGLDVNRFVSEVDDELICPICNDVLEDHYQISSCEHLFCAACIQPLIRENRVFSCPVDRKEVRAAELKQSRVINNILANLKLRCNSHGCSSVVALGDLPAHLKQCLLHLQQMVRCEGGCGHNVRRCDLRDHNCINELSSQLNISEERIVQLTKQRDLLLEQNLKLLEENKILKSHDNHKTRSECEGAVGRSDMDEDWEDLGTLVVCDCDDHRLPTGAGCVTDCDDHRLPSGAGCVTDTVPPANMCKFEREAEFHAVECFNWTRLGRGTLKIVEDEFGFGMLMEIDGHIVSSTTISIQTDSYLEDSSAAWSALDLMCDPPAKRRLRATFTHIRHLAEFDKVFKEGKKHAERFHITED